MSKTLIGKYLTYLAVILPILRKDWTCASHSNKIVKMRGAIKK